MNKKLYDQVKWMLENEIETRSNDDLLCALINSRRNPKVMDLPYIQVRVNEAHYGLYSTETITRVRREVQEDNPELKVEMSERRRARREQEYRDYYKEKKING